MFSIKKVIKGETRSAPGVTAATRRVKNVAKALAGKPGRV
jgi:hypothetical protein